MGIKDSNKGDDSEGEGHHLDDHVHNSQDPGVRVWEDTVQQQAWWDRNSGIRSVLIRLIT